MAIVSALKATRSGRVAVHLDGAFFCTVGEALLVRLGLFAGRSLTDEQVALLQSEASAERAVADAHRLLAQRPRARAEIQTRLTAKGHPQEAVQRALAQLQARGLLDDHAFAAAYVADRRRLHGWGTDRIAHELARLGADPAAVQAALADSAGGSDEEQELQRALQLLSRRAPGRPPQAAQRRAYQLLLRRGFSTTVAYDAVRRWSADAGNTDESSQAGRPRHRARGPAGDARLGRRTPCRPQGGKGWKGAGPRDVRAATGSCPVAGVRPRFSALLSPSSKRSALDSCRMM